MEERCFTDTPWVCVTYTMTDDESDAVGYTRCVFDCCVCGETKDVQIPWPPKDDPIWKNLGPKGIPGAYNERVLFQLEHMHPDSHGSGAVLTWAKPLRNLAALPGGKLDLKELEQRLRTEMAK